MLAASKSSAQSCADCIPIPRSTFELSKKAVDEVKVSRTLIDRLTRENELLQENSKLKDQLNAALIENGQLKDRRLTEKQKEVDGERTARELTEKQLGIETKEKLKAQSSAKFWRKWGPVIGSIATLAVQSALH